MIVVDENIHTLYIMQAIASWYPGPVLSVTTLRPGTIIKDEAIPTLLLKVAQPTFVTINVTDFWRRTRPHPEYCVVAVSLPKERVAEIPDLLRRFCRLAMFNTKAGRMGKIIRLASDRIEYYESDWTVQTVSW